jgi:DNA repair photolyase
MMMKKVISASRRTDIPAYYADWLIRKIRDGSVRVRNPFNPSQAREVSLKPEEVHSIVLWSKNFYPLFRFLDRFSDYHLFLQFTINDAPPLEPNVPPLDERLELLGLLVGRLGPERVNWRFDPIVLWDGGKSNNLESFPRIAETASRLGLRRCTFSFAHWYRKSVRRARKRDFRYHSPERSEILELTRWLRDAAGARGIELESCCTETALEGDGIRRASCINGRLLSELKGEPADTSPHPSRKGCGCTKSVDIGDYHDQSCLANCVYCYANPKLT